MRICKEHSPRVRDRKNSPAPRRETRMNCGGNRLAGLRRWPRTGVIGSLGCSASVSDGSGALGKKKRPGPLRSPLDIVSWVGLRPQTAAIWLVRGRFGGFRHGIRRCQTPSGRPSAIMQRGYAVNPGLHYIRR